LILHCISLTDPGCGGSNDCPCQLAAVWPPDIATSCANSVLKYGIRARQTAAAMLQLPAANEAWYRAVDARLNDVCSNHCVLVQAC
jgi:hypothetical protein